MVAFNQLPALQEHMESLFSADKQLIRNSFNNQLPKLLQDYISYETWKYKGSIHGIHNDFGMHSYLQSKELGEYYHISDEDRINLILQNQEFF